MIARSVPHMLGHASSLYKTEVTGMDFVQDYYSHPSAQIPSQKKNDNNVGHKESCNSDVKVEPYISPNSKHPFYIYGDVPHDYGFLQNLELPLPKSLRTSLPIRSFQNDVASSASPAFRSHDLGDVANPVSKFQPFTSPPSDLESCTHLLQGASEGRLYTRVYQGGQLANNSIAELNSYRKATMEGHYQTKTFSSPYAPVKYNHYGSCSAVYFRQDGSENHLAQPSQPLTSYHSITNAVPLGMAPISSSTNRSDVLTVHPTDLWKNPPGVPGTNWSGAVLSHKMSHPSNMSISCQESQSYNDADTSNENTYASSFRPSRASQLPYTQIAYQQRGSNHINTHSPTLYFPSNGVQIQGEQLINSAREAFQAYVYIPSVNASEQISPSCTVDTKTGKAILYVLTTSNISAACRIVQIAKRGTAQKQKPSVIGSLFTILVKPMLNIGNARFRLVNGVLRCSQEETSIMITVINGMGNSHASIKDA
ncbi:hypothetical protein BHYA_0025g00640 [Botrytis hyacinthi]|uniref:Uncharacterized protein n=1 Tax=Botrytis hyacinthi TaxID=278943 RepID=A0A4Z1H0P2_9HELO|nr:hypothetical protein BHYA_0025g00640 [Botrytis hyacinthi]